MENKNAEVKYFILCDEVGEPIGVQRNVISNGEQTIQVAGLDRKIATIDDGINKINLWKSVGIKD